MQPSPSPSPGTVAGLAARLTGDVRARWLAGVAGLAVAGLAASSDDGVVLCPFRRCTGGYCPGCGLTRSAGALLRGGVGASWRHHPYLLLAVGQVVLLGLWSLVGGRRAAGRLRRWESNLLIGNAVVLVAIWLLRLASGSVPAPFG